MPQNTYYQLWAITIFTEQFIIPSPDPKFEGYFLWKKNGDNLINSLQIKGFSTCPYYAMLVLQFLQKIDHLLETFRMCVQHVLPCASIGKQLIKQHNRETVGHS